MNTFLERSILAALPLQYFLLVVDDQHDFFDLEGSCLPIPDSKKVIEPTNQFLQMQRYNQCKGVLFTQDWHNADHVEYMPDGNPFPKHCVEGTKGAKLAVLSATVPSPIPLLNLRKNVFNMWEESSLQVAAMDPVSRIRFGNEPQDRDAFFAEMLEKGLKDVVVIGVASDICVNFAIKGLVERGFNVTVVRPLCKGLFREIDQVVAEDYNNSVAIVG